MFHDDFMHAMEQSLVLEVLSRLPVWLVDNDLSKDWLSIAHNLDRVFGCGAHTVLQRTPSGNEPSQIESSDYGS